MGNPYLPIDISEDDISVPSYAQIKNYLNTDTPSWGGPPSVSQLKANVGEPVMSAALQLLPFTGAFQLPENLEKGNYGYAALDALSLLADSLMLSPLKAAAKVGKIPSLIEEMKMAAKSVDNAVPLEMVTNGWKSADKGISKAAPTLAEAMESGGYFKFDDDFLPAEEVSKEWKLLNGDVWGASDANYPESLPPTKLDKAGNVIFSEADIPPEVQLDDIPSKIEQEEETGLKHWLDEFGTHDIHGNALDSPGAGPPSAAAAQKMGLSEEEWFDLLHDEHQKQIAAGLEFDPHDYLGDGPDQIAAYEAHAYGLSVKDYIDWLKSIPEKDIAKTAEAFDDPALAKTWNLFAGKEPANPLLDAWNLHDPALDAAEEAAYPWTRPPQLSLIGYEDQIEKAREYGMLSYQQMKDELQKQIPELAPERLEASRDAIRKLKDISERREALYKEIGSDPNLFMHEHPKYSDWLKTNEEYEDLYSTDLSVVKAFDNIFEGKNMDAPFDLFHGSAIPMTGEGFEDTLRGAGAGGQSANISTFGTVLPDEGGSYARYAKGPGEAMLNKQIDNIWEEIDALTDQKHNLWLANKGFVDESWKLEYNKLEELIQAKHQQMKDLTAKTLDPAWQPEPAPNILRLWLRANPEELHIVNKMNTGYGDITKHVKEGINQGKAATLLFNIQDPFEFSTHVALPDTSRFRLPWARLDPDKKHLKNLLAGMGGAGLMSVLPDAVEGN